MNLTTLVILLIALTAAVIAGILTLYKSKHDSSYIKKVKEQKNKPLMGNSEDYNYMGHQTLFIGIAAILMLIMVTVIE